MRWAAGLCWLLPALSLPAAPLPEAQALAVLRQVAAAAREQSFSGVYTHQTGQTVDTFRIVHLGGNDRPRERRESLDGPPWEVVRDRASMTVYAPTGASLAAAQAGAFQTFPALLGDRLADIVRHYTLEKLGPDRVAGHDCSWWMLSPREPGRYARRFCADPASGMALKSATLAENRTQLEQYSFTQFVAGLPADATALAPRYAGGVAWRSALNATATRGKGVGVTALPAGFMLMHDVTRRLGQDGSTVRHLIYGDGVASVSLFIEPVRSVSRAAPPVVGGPIKLCSQALGDMQVTVVGDLPDNTLQSIARSVRLLP